MVDDTTITLPRRSRAGWITMTLAGLALLLASAPPILLTPTAVDDSMHLLLMGSGAGLFLACFGLLILMNRQRAAKLHIHGDDQALELVTADGSSVRLPLDAILRAEAYSDPNGTDRRVLVLRKRDGGVLELASLPFDDAEDLLEPLQAVFEGRELPASGLEDLVGDPLERLAGAKGVTAARSGDTVDLRWKPGWPLQMALPLLGPFVGMGLIGLGFQRLDPGLGATLFTAFSLTLGVIVLVFTLINVGVIQRVAVDARHLTIERLRFGKAIKRQQVPIFSVVAVDYSHQLNVQGAALNVRTRAGQDAKESVEDATDPLGAVKALVSLVSGGIQIPTGRLGLADRVALDLAIGEEIARRSGKRAAQL